ncbi:MAG: hypothetical protein CMJ64_00620 [Planctomycetaceae bacterium]|jgi:hypothetical protein|nr:hypothetical protein [Planctomycetaceae bacterium]
MKNVLKTMCLLALAVVIALPLAAEDKKKKKKKGGKRGSPTAALVKKVKAAGVSEETLKKVEEIAASFNTKIAEARKGLGDARQKIAAARKKAQDDGKKGKELQAAVRAVELTDEQKAAQKELQGLNRELNTKVAALLTPEQRQKTKIGGGGGNAKKKKKKKDDA